MEYKQLMFKGQVEDHYNKETTDGYSPLQRKDFDKYRSQIGTLILDHWEHGLLKEEGQDYLDVSDTYYALMAIRRGEKSERILIANVKMIGGDFEPEQAIIIDTYVGNQNASSTIRHLDLSKLDGNDEDEDWITFFWPNEELDRKLLNIVAIGDLKYWEAYRKITNWFGIDVILG